MDAIITFLNECIWSWPLVGLCLAAALYFSFGTRFVQVRHLPEMVRLLFKNDRSKRAGISSFQAFALALSGRVGTGNIVGVALAIGFGGPGAIVWMWIIAFLGAGTAFAEACLAQIYKQHHGDQLRGGPAYYIEKGLNCSWLAILFAATTVIACALCLPPIHSNSIAMSFSTTFNLQPWIVGLCVAALIALVVLGGVKRISRVAEIVTPFMAIAYIILSIVVLIVNAHAVPGAFRDMIASAFGYHEALGGIVGAAIAWGVKRGIYSNEAGQGTAPIVAAAAQTRNPVRQALVSSSGTFWDTVVICALTGLVIVSSVIAYPDINYTDGATLTKAAFSKIPVVGLPLLSFGLLTFAFSTILGWSYYGERALEYLTGKKFITAYRVIYIIAVFVGSIASLTIVWNFADCMNALMALPNLVSLLLLSSVLVKETRKYLWEKQLDTPSLDEE